MKPQDVWYEDWIERLIVQRHSMHKEIRVIDPIMHCAFWIVDEGDKKRIYTKTYFSDGYDYVWETTSWLELLTIFGITKGQVALALLVEHRKGGNMSRVRWEGDNQKPEVKVTATAHKSQYGDECHLQIDEPYKPFDISFPNAGPFFDLQDGDQVEITIKLSNPLGPNDTWPRRKIT